MRKKHYVGIIVDSIVRETFSSEEKPTCATHGKLYSAVIGPFRTKRGADYMSHFGFNNPHCQHVDDAERLAKEVQS